MVPKDLSRGAGVKYKEEPKPVADDPHHPHPSHQGPPHTSQHPRSSGVAQQNQHPGSPHLSNNANVPGAYTSPHGLSNGLPLQHQSPYGPPPSQPQDANYFASHPSPYSTPSATGPYSSADNPDLMAAAAHMQRPYPPIYHTPQSNSPASVASPQTHDQHGRSLYGQPAPLPQQMYAYPQYPPMNQVHPSPYGQHPGSQQHSLTSQPLLMSHQQGAAQMQHPQAQPHPAAMNNSPRMKLEPSAQQQQPQQRTPMTSTPHAQTPQMQQNNMHPGQQGSAGVNPNAAPGPIPATTPLVVRQDNNGVQWIAFEYSRDRVKMEYTIRCDVESVNVDTLSQDFKTENCVYPRACCSKDQYRGNRLVYETECNAVGWALAELNPCLRAKRGLIQRAVDSWRNSNQDPRLRSRRVRRMAKMNNRKVQSTQHPTAHLATPNGPGSAGVAGTTNGMPTPAARQPGNIPLGSAQLRHHHAHPDGTATGGEDAGNDYSSGTQHPRQGPNGHSAPPNDVRQSQVFHGYSGYPTAPNTAGQALAPSLHSGMDASGRGPSGMTTISAAPKESEDGPSIFGDVPEAKRRKFILVDDTQRGNRVRVKVMLEQVDMKEIPDSYRKSNSVYPRSYFPMQMQTPPSSSRGRRYFEDEAVEEDEGYPIVGRTLVPVPMLDGAEGEVAVPKIARNKHDKETVLNDLGYRMSWSQSRVFAGRTLFLQRALDAYRNKMRSTMITSGSETSSVAPHFETRIGKRRWLERGRKPKRDGSPQSIA